MTYIICSIVWTVCGFVVWLGDSPDSHAWGLCYFVLAALLGIVGIIREIKRDEGN